MRKSKKYLLSAALSLLGLMAPQSARGQFIGDVGLQTVNSQLATNATCTGSAQIFTVQNIGQIAHQASANSTAGSLTMEIDGLDGFVATYRISNPQVSFPNGGGTSYIVQGSGYYPKVQIVVTCTAAATFSLSYAGAQSGFNTIIGPPQGTTVNLGGIIGNVQGIVPQQTNASNIFPIIEGGLQLPINTNFINVGIDNFNTGIAGVPISTAGTITVATAPQPSQTGEFALAFEGNLGDVGLTAPVSPWTCALLSGGTCSGASPQFSLESLANIAPGQRLQRSYQNSTPGGNDIAAIVLFSSPTAAVRQATLAGNPISISATLTTSTLIAALKCSGTVPCVVSGVTDTQANTWNPVTSIVPNNAQQAAGVIVWASSTRPTIAADTITFTLSSGTAAGVIAVEVANTGTSSLTQPSISVQADPTGRQVITQDAQSPNQFVCNVTLSTNTTTQCQAPPTTINGVAVRTYVTDFQINTTAAGTTSTLTLKTGTGSNCGTGTANLSAIVYPMAVSISSFLGMRTPLIAPLQSAVCVTQGGGTAGTAVVEIHGFFAP